MCCSSRTYFDLFFSLLYFSESLHLLSANCHLCSLGSRCDNKDKVAKDLLQVILVKSRGQEREWAGKPSDHSVGLAPMKEEARRKEIGRKSFRLQCSSEKFRVIWQCSPAQMAHRAINQQRPGQVPPLWSVMGWELPGRRVVSNTVADPGVATREGHSLHSSQMKGDLLLQARSKQSLYSCHIHY